VPGASRSLASYVAVPRPAEAWVKGWLAVIAYGIARLGDTGTGASVAEAAAAWAIFELGLYQARYVVNDVADVEVDRSHPAASTRGRLPDVPAARRIATVGAVARVVLSIAAVALLPDRARGVTVGAALGLAAAAVAYEAARTPLRRRPLGQGAPRWGAAEVGVFGVVGAGYAARIALGAGLAGIGGWLLAAVVAYGWVFGTMVVVLTWTIEAAGLRAAGATEVLRRKAHVGVLAARLLDGSETGERPIAAGRPAWFGAGAQAATMALALIVAAGLDGAPAPAGVVALVAVCVVGSPVAMAASPWPWTGWLAVAANAATCALAAGVAAGSTLALVTATSAAVAAFRVLTPAELAGLDPVEPHPAERAPIAEPGATQPRAGRTIGP
jgi:4-hydroxybenzoate polyprenyltransferase